MGERLQVQKIKTPTVEDTKNAQLHDAYKEAKGAPTSGVEYLKQHVEGLTDNEYYACWRLAILSDLEIKEINENGGFTKIVTKMIELAKRDAKAFQYSEENIEKNAVKDFGSVEKTFTALREEREQEGQEQ